MSGGLGVAVYDILHAIGEANRPVQTSDIAKATGMSRQSVAQHIKWRMLHNLVKIVSEERQSNGYHVRYYTLTSRGKEKLEASG